MGDLPHHGGQLGTGRGRRPEVGRRAAELLLTLAEVAGRGGNLLLNVTPDGEGRVPAWQRERLQAIAAWMAVHRDAIVGTDAGLAPWQFAGPTTRRGGVVYLICPMQPTELVVLRGVPGKRLAGVRVQGTGEPLPFALRLGVLDRILDSDPLCAVVIDVSRARFEGRLPVLEVMFGA
jgi:alpha-L-fucosidase